MAMLTEIARPHHCRAHGGGRVVSTADLPEKITDANAIWQSVLTAERAQAIAVITFPGNAGPLLDSYGRGFKAGIPLLYFFGRAQVL